MNLNSIILSMLFSFSLYANEFIVDTNATLILDSGTYILKDIELKNNIVIKGKNKFTTILKLDKDAKKALFYAKDKSNIEISNLTIINETTTMVPLLYFEGKAKEIKNITIKNCIIKSIYAKTDVIIFRNYMSNIRIEDNIIEAKKNPKIRRDYKQITAIRLQGSSVYSKNNSYVYIKNNIIKYGNCGFRITGKKILPPNPLWFENNIVQGQLGCGAFFYHGARQKIINNYFSNITAVSLKNNDGGVVWLDQYRDFSNIYFVGNTIENCKGNAIFIEELKSGIIKNNFIKNIGFRKNDIFQGSRAGNGIVITGGTQHTLIKNNIMDNIKGKKTILSKNLGVHKGFPIKKNIIIKNYYYEKK